MVNGLSTFTFIIASWPSLQSADQGVSSGPSSITLNALRVSSNLHGAAGAGTDGDQHKRRDTNLRSMTARFDEGMGGGRERDLIISGAMFRSVAQRS